MQAFLEGRLKGSLTFFFILGKAALKIGRTCVQGHMLMLMQQMGINDVFIIVNLNKELRGEGRKLFF